MFTLNSGNRHRQLRMAIIGFTCLVMALPPNLFVQRAYAVAQIANNNCHVPSSPPAETCPLPGQNVAPAKEGNLGTSQTLNPVNFNLNSAVEQVVDLQVSGPALTWAHARTYDSRMSRTGYTEAEGVRWHGGAFGPYLREIALNHFHLYLNATSYREIEESGGTYAMPDDTATTMVRTGSGVKWTPIIGPRA